MDGIHNDRAGEAGASPSSPSPRSGLPEPRSSVVDLRQVVQSLAEPERDARLWLNGAGEVAGFAALSVGRPAINLVCFGRGSQAGLPLTHTPTGAAGLAETVSPGAGLGSTILRWALARAGEISHKVGSPVRLELLAREDDTAWIGLLEGYGFVRGSWRALRFLRRLTAAGTPEAPVVGEGTISLPEPRLPPGFTIRHVNGEQELEACVTLHHEAFGTANLTIEERRSWMRDPGYVPELDLVAVAPDGEPVSFAFGGIDHDEAASGQRPHGYIDPIGTHPGFRRLGLARALVFENLRRLQARGVQEVDTTTSGEHTAMQRLLESAGYVFDYAKLPYVRELE